MLKPAFKALKYGDRPGVGTVLGRSLGRYLAAYEHFRKCDVIVPVPLYHRKRRKRGYNQALIISIAVGKELGIPVRSDILERRHSGLTQTKKNKWQRQVAVMDSYHVIPKQLPYNSVLIIDDIITTGSTITACGEAFRDHPGTSLLAASVAFTQK
jgi:ComF family protein